MKKSFLTFGCILLILNSCQNKSEEAKSVTNDIVFKDKAGHMITKSELENTTGKINYEIMDNKNIDPTARKLHREARELGQSGKYDLAISKLEETIKIQPDWSYPIYDLAFTYLLKGDFDNALKFYKKIRCPRRFLASSFFPFWSSKIALFISRIPLVSASGFFNRPCSIALNFSALLSIRLASSFHAGAKSGTFSVKVWAISNFCSLSSVHSICR